MRITPIASLILIAAFGSQAASASSAGLGVGVEVLPSRAAPALVEALPMPAFSRSMAVDAGTPGQAAAILHAGLDASTGHFQATMPALGYRLVSSQQRGSRTIQLWSRGEDHVRMEFEQALGGDQPLVRLRSSGHRSPPALAAR